MSVQPCPTCGSADLAATKNEWLCRSCNERWEKTVGNTMSADELERVVGGVWLQTPEMAIARSNKRPNITAIEDGIAGLTRQRAENRLAKAEHAISVLTEIEAILLDNLREEWRDGASERRLRSETAMPGDVFVAQLDRLLTHVSEYEERWQRIAGRDPKAIWRNSWKHTGEQVADAILRLADQRVLLQITTTLLRERLAS
jgi:hypothetical protein